jgi:exodeoxyribonuclease VII large subunit
MPRQTPSAPQLGFAFEEPRRARSVFSVSDLVGKMRELAESEFGDVWIEGEISNLRPAPSGHVYFTLKDANAQLPVVLFRRQAMLLRFRPQDGQRVLARGKVSVYEQRGQLQLVAETIEPVGAGSLQLAFEQLKEKLKAEGLFDAERKQPLPAFPRSVAIVTSPTGAAIRDFLNIVGRRNAGLNVLLYPVSVQGDSAPGEIAAAIEELNRAQMADLIVLARGGGSLEDLAAFNSERVAREIASSRLPVVSAIGHETDFTIADFVADLRAPTPSAAAELITESQHKVAEEVAALIHRLDRAARFQLLQARQRLAQVSVVRAEARVQSVLHRYEQRLDDLSQRAENAMAEKLRALRRQTEALAAAVLRRDPRQKLSQARERLIDQRTRLERAFAADLHQLSARWRALDARLHALSPLAVLERGYALVLDSQGAVIRSTAKLTPGAEIATRLADGSFTSRVETIAPNKISKRKKNNDGQ